MQSQTSPTGFICFLQAPQTSAASYLAYPNQISAWKKQLLDGVSGLFEDGRKRSEEESADAAALYEQIGRLKVELDWLKKTTARFDDG